jgi:hypothetical protein
MPGYDFPRRVPTGEHSAYKPYCLPEGRRQNPSKIDIENCSIHIENRSIRAILVQSWCNNSMAKQIMYRMGQAAKDLGVSTYRLRRLCETGVVNAEFTASRQWEIPAAEIERLKQEGVPSAPRIVDSEAEASSPPNGKERATSTLLANPSPELVYAAEESEMSSRQLATAKNKLEENKVLWEQTEIEDRFADRQRRLREQEEAENRRYEEELESEARRRHKEEAAAQRQKFFSEWLEYALKKKPYGAPNEIELDIHSEVLAALAKVDVNEKTFVVRRLVDAATERGLRTWKADEAKRAVINEAIAQAPYEMRWHDLWKLRTRKAASDALKDLGSSMTQDEMTPVARTALQPLIQEFEHARKIEQAVNSVRINGATYDELSEAQEVVREALSDLPNNAGNRQITESKEAALAPLAARVTERVAREDAEHRREQVLSGMSWRLPSQISDDDKESAIAEIKEALDDLPADASQREMEKARDEIVESYRGAYEKKARRAQEKTAQARKKTDLVKFGLAQIRPYAEKMLRKFDYGRGESVWSIESRVKTEVREVLQQELSGEESESEVAQIVRQVMLGFEGCR